MTSHPATIHFRDREAEGMSAPEQHQGASVRVEGDMAVIRIPLAEVHGLRVALAPCPCRAPKSSGTMTIRQRLAKALGKVKA